MNAPRTAAGQDRNAPTWENQLYHARRLLAEKGRDALNNPHAMTGKICGCGACFCCAALYVMREGVRPRSDW